MGGEVIRASGGRVLQKRDGRLAIEWTDEQRQLFFGTLAQSCHAARAAEAAKISLGQAYYKRRTDAVFAEEWRVALENGYERLEEELLRLAIEGLRGPEHHFAWCDELGKWGAGTGMAAWDNLMMGMRLGAAPRVLVTTTPRGTDLMRRVMALPGLVETRGGTRDNPHLPASFVEAVTADYAGTRLGRQELDGELIDEVAGALWTRAGIEGCRVKRRPALVRVVVAVDPPTSAGGDACGIVAVGLGLKAAAAREIALAFGVPAMLLGLPGDAAYANYREANKALWRLAILPLAGTLLKGLAHGLRGWFPGAAVDIDLDRISVLHDERERLWRSVTAADFLSVAEKREMLGFAREVEA